MTKAEAGCTSRALSFLVMTSPAADVSINQSIGLITHMIQSLISLKGVPLAFSMQLEFLKGELKRQRTWRHGMLFALLWMRRFTSHNLQKSFTAIFTPVFLSMVLFSPHTCVYSGSSSRRITYVVTKRYVFGLRVHQ